MRFSAPVFSMTDVGGSTPAPEPIASQDGSDLFDIDANMAEFFGHRLDERSEPEAQPVSEPNPTPAPALNPGTTAAPESAPVPASPAQPTPNAEPAASAPDGGGDDEVDPNLLASIMLGQTPPAAAAPAEAPAKATPPAGATDDNQPYMPIQASEVKIPSAVLQSIFNSEDPVQQEQALVQLLAGWGNALTSMMDQRVREHYLPRVQEQFTQRQQQEATDLRTTQDFYGRYPDLKEVPQIVAKVSQAVAQQQPDASYEQVRDVIGKTARVLAKQMGVKITAPAPAAAPVPAQPFVAGGARPASHSQIPGFDPLDPAQMVEQLATAGF